MLSLGVPIPAAAVVALLSLFANFTSSVRPRTLLPCISLIALSADWTPSNLTNPNPLDVFVLTSLITQHDSTTPNASKTLFSVSGVERRQLELKGAEGGD